MNFVLIFKYSLLLVLLIFSAYVDAKSKEIYEFPLILGGIIALIIALTGYSDISIWSAIAGAIVFAVCFYPICRYLGLGEGDLEVMVMIGLFLGISSCFYIFCFTFMSGGIIALLYVGVKWVYNKIKKIKIEKSLLKEEFPMAPSILIGTVLYLYLIGIFDGIAFYFW